MQPIPSIQQLTNFFQGISATPGSKEGQTALARFDNLAPDAASLSGTLNQQFGVDDLRGRVSALRKGIVDTENAIEGVGDNVLGRTSGSLVSQAQVDRLTQKEQEPLFDVLGTKTQDLGFTSADAQDAQTRSDRFLGFTLDDIAQKRGSIQDRINLALNREDTARQEAARQSQLSSILDRFNSIGSRLDALGQNIAASRSRLQSGISSADRTLQNAQSSRFLQPAASGRTVQRTANPQRVGSGRSIQSGGGGITLQGRGAISGGTPLSVSRGGSNQRIGGVTMARPGTISGVGYAQPRQSIIGVSSNPYASRSLVVR